MMASRTLFNKPVGIGSASQVFAGEESIIFDTSSQLKGRNFTRALEMKRLSEISPYVRYLSDEKPVKCISQFLVVKPGGE